MIVSKDRPAFRSNPVAILALIVVFSLLARVILILKGGPLTDYDEAEYFRFSKQVYEHLLNFDLKGVFNTPVFAHWGCILWGVLPFFLTPDFLQTKTVAALFFSLPSSINIALLYVITVKVGIQRWGALIAAALYALSVSNLYLARHILPYDLSLMFIFLSALVILSAKENNLRVVFISGFLCFVAFFTYYGYWLFTSVVMMFAVFFKDMSWRKIIAKGAACGLGFLLPLLIFWGLSSYYGGDFLYHLQKFSSTIRGGSFSEGTYFHLIFLYHAEGLLLIVWLLCIVKATILIGRSRRAKFFLCTIGYLYAMWVIGSNIMESFVVYGRLVKQIVPLFCVLAGFILCRADKRLVVLVFLIAMYNFSSKYWAMYNIVYDDTFNETLEHYKSVNEASDQYVETFHVADPPHPDQHIPDECKLVYSIPYYLNLKFLQYDGMRADMRKFHNQYDVYRQIFVCSK